jgi:PKHD-type hydroxylase
VVRPHAGEPNIEYMTKLTVDPIKKLYWTVPWSWYDGAFTADEIDRIVREMDLLGTQPSTVIGDNTVNAVKDRYRSSQQKMHGVNQYNKWIFDRLLNVSQEINEKDYNFDLWGFDHFQYTVYNVNEEYKAHSDIIYTASKFKTLTRKLSISLVLSDNYDYEGGEFQIITAEQSEASTVEQKKGRLIVFPSWMVHKVKPVTRGVRKSIVVWVVGPNFK